MKEKKKHKFAFTFGSGHHDPNHPSLGEYYTVIEKENQVKARELMYERRSTRWSHCYEWKSFESQIEKFGLKLIEFKDLKPQEGPTR